MLLLLLSGAAGDPAGEGPEAADVDRQRLKGSCGGPCESCGGPPDWGAPFSDRRNKAQRHLEAIIAAAALNAAAAAAAFGGTTAAAAWNPLPARRS